jgi:hypothetical protein
MLVTEKGQQKSHVLVAWFVALVDFFTKKKKRDQHSILFFKKKINK